MTDHKEVVPASQTDGKIEISPQAVASIAAYAATRSYGVVGMAAKNAVDGIATMLTGDPHRGIDVHIGSDAVAIDLHVIVEYGTRITSVAHSVANTVRFSVEKTTGLSVSEVNVYVQGLRVSTTD
ncbi:MAG: Asp23/Gls24 family envelope stress response protein [Chloroflexi bacterium]|nr:Asp23/Gls24 family envelope stress response protein [Chloroflexota bacterium]